MDKEKKKKTVQVPIEYFHKLLEMKQNAENELKLIRHSDSVRRDSLWQLMGFIEAITDRFLY